MSSGIINLNIKKFSGYGGLFKADTAMYLLYTKEADVHLYHISVPIMFLSPAFTSCHEPNCFFHGEVHYTNDPDFCSYANEHEPVAEFCKQLEAPILVEDLNYQPTSFFKEGL